MSHPIEAADAIAAAVATAPILDRIETLDMSLGALGDEGAEALLASARVEKLKRLDLHHNFITTPVSAKLRKLKLTLDVRPLHNLQFDDEDGRSSDGTGRGRRWQTDHGRN